MITGDTVTIHFVCRLEDGTIIDTSIGREPLQFIIGQGTVLCGLEDAVRNMHLAESKTIMVKPEQAFGLSLKEKVKVIDMSRFPTNMQPVIGQEVEISEADGKTSVMRVIEVSETWVTLDANLPLAGKTLLFDLRVIEVSRNSDFSHYAHIQRGNLLREQELIDEAIECYQTAIQMNQNYIAYNNLGNALAEKGHLSEAVVAYRQALGINPYYEPAYCNLGKALLDQGNLDEAITCYQNAARLDPKSAKAHYALGLAFQKKGLTDSAVESYQKAIALAPGFTETYLNLGAIFRESHRNQDSLEIYKKAISYNPHDIRALWMSCIAELPVIYSDESSIQDIRRRYHEKLSALHEKIFSSPLDDIKAFSIGGLEQPFYLPYQGFNDRDLQKLSGEIMCRIMAVKYPQFSRHIAMAQCTSYKKIRIGFVSGFFCRHSNWKIPIKGWIEQIDKTKFDLFGYYTGNKKDTETDAARKHCARFVEDIRSFEGLCHAIRDDDLHIIVYPEIGMDPIVARLAALRLAPVQCVSWGHPNTSGFPTIDYFLSSDLMEPEDADTHYSENLIRLPNLSIYYVPLEAPHVDIKRETYGVRRDAVLYLCCQSLKKYLPQYDFIYPRIAAQVSNCQFLFISQDSNWLNHDFHLRISKAFEAADLHSDDYLVMLPRLHPGEYHAVNCFSDIYLDSISWSGSNTTLEAIACNLPIVTLPGKYMRGRHSMAILKMLGVHETIAENFDDYIQKAIKLGENRNYRQEFSDKIRESKYRVYRDKASIIALENFFEKTIDSALSVS